MLTMNTFILHNAARQRISKTKNKETEINPNRLKYKLYTLTSPIVGLYCLLQIQKRLFTVRNSRGLYQRTVQDQLQVTIATTKIL